MPVSRVGRKKNVMQTSSTRKKAKVKQKERGRPGRKYPPRIDATPDQLAEAFFRAKPSQTLNEDQDYRCASCQREVNYPETLYRDGRCVRCTVAPVN